MGPHYCSLKELNLYFNIMNVTFCLLSQENLKYNKMKMRTGGPIILMLE